MQIVFYVAGAVAVVATVLMLAQRVAVHALLYLVVSLLAVAVVFYDLGAPFVAALEIIIYAGAIMVLFVFVVMLLNVRIEAARGVRLRSAAVWIGPGILSAILIAELVYLLATGEPGYATVASINPEEVGVALFGPYVIGVELASMLLLAGLVGAYHLGLRKAERGKESWN